jgi:hypothetical protein
MYKMIELITGIAVGVVLNFVMLVILMIYIRKVDKALSIFTRVISLSDFLSRMEEYETMRKMAEQEHAHKEES